MKATLTPDSSKSKPLLRKIVYISKKVLYQVWSALAPTGVWIPLTFLLLMLWRAPHLVPEDFDYDEGINLMKALLYHHGYGLYEDIWSDQPPLLTALLSWWFVLWGHSVAAARVLIILFSCLLLWGFYLAVRTSVSAPAASVAVALLIISEYYLRLSGAVMVGLPALAMATTAVALLVTGRAGVWRVLGSAAVMALALQIKLVVALLIPAVVVHLLSIGAQTEIRRSKKNYLLQAAIWLAALFGLFWTIGYYFNALRPDMLLNTHFGSETWQQLSFIRASSSFLPNFYKQHLPYMIAALLGVPWALYGQNQRLILPLVWFGSTWIALTLHRPLWYHHVTLLSVPLAWLSAFGIEYWMRSFLHPRRACVQRRIWLPRVLFGGAAAAFVIFVILYPKPLAKRLDEQMRLNRPQFDHLVLQHLATGVASESGWVFTDRPFYGFVVNAPVPPPIAVMSRKRLQANKLPDEVLINTIDTYLPVHVVLERFLSSYSQLLLDGVDGRYELIVETERARYYRLRAAP